MLAIGNRGKNGALRFVTALVTVPLLAPLTYAFVTLLFEHSLNSKSHFLPSELDFLPEILFTGLALLGLPNYVAFFLLGGPAMIVLCFMRRTSFLSFGLAGMVSAALTLWFLTYKNLSVPMALSAFIWPGSLGFFEGLATRLIVFGRGPASAEAGPPVGSTPSNDYLFFAAFFGGLFFAAFFEAGVAFFGGGAAPFLADAFFAGADFFATAACRFVLAFDDTFLEADFVPGDFAGALAPFFTGALAALFLAG